MCCIHRGKGPCRSCCSIPCIGIGSFGFGVVDEMETRIIIRCARAHITGVCCITDQATVRSEGHCISLPRKCSRYRASGVMQTERSLCSSWIHPLAERYLDGCINNICNAILRVNRLYVRRFCIRCRYKAPCERSGADGVARQVYCNGTDRAVICMSVDQVAERHAGTAGSRPPRSR